VCRAYSNTFEIISLFRCPLGSLSDIRSQWQKCTCQIRGISLDWTVS
jgi:hypothetical protein